MSTLRVLSHYSLFTNNNKKQSPPPPKLPRLQVEKEGKWREVESSPAVQNCQRQIQVRFYFPQILVTNAFSVKKWRSMWNSSAIKPLKPSLSSRFNLGHHFIQLASIWNILVEKVSTSPAVQLLHSVYSLNFVPVWHLIEGLLMWDQGKATCERITLDYIMSLVQLMNWLWLH